MECTAGEVEESVVEGDGYDAGARIFVDGRGKVHCSLSDGDIGSGKFYQGNEDGKVFLLIVSSIGFQSCSMRQTSLVLMYVDIGLMDNQRNGGRLHKSCAWSGWM